MRIRSLEHFVALARAGSFYQAAKGSDLSVQGYAKMLSSLEAELGVELATRNQSGIHLTPAGEILLEDAQGIIERWNQAKSRIDAIESKRAEDVGRLKVFTTHYGMQTISQLEHAYEELSKYDLYEESFDKILLRAKKSNPSEIYIADVFTDTALADIERDGFTFEELFVSFVGLLVRDDCPLAQLDAVTLADISTLKMSSYFHREWNLLIEKTLGKQLSRDTLFESTAFNLLLGFVKAASDHGILTDSLSVYGIRKRSVHYFSDMRFIPLKEQAARLHLGVLYRRNRPALKAPSIAAAWQENAHLWYVDYYDELAQMDRIIQTG